MDHPAHNARRSQIWRHLQARAPAHLAPQLRHPLARRRRRHSHRAGALGPRRRQDHHDLHPCPQSRRARHCESAGSDYRITKTPHRSTKSPLSAGFFMTSASVYMASPSDTLTTLHLYCTLFSSSPLKSMHKPRVYSYLRFSDPRQAAGSSADRQTEYARRWAAERGMVLDEALSMRDEGLSAYHQRHVKQGALGVFLAAVDEGRIAGGSVLIVEGLDRLSRAEPIQAQAQLAQIVNAGITVVTASDGREYNRASLKAQPMDLVYSLLVMIRAHDESDTKRKRVKAAIRRQCEGWLAGTWRGVIRNGKDPAWVTWTGQRFELVEERAAAVRLAVAMFRSGEGAVRILREMARRGLDDAVGASSGNLYKIFRLPALMGTKRIEVAGEAYQLPGYYPALLSEAEWGELQHLIGQRHRRRGRGEMVGQNMMGRRRQADGRPQDGHRRLICCGYAHGTGCPVPGSCSVVPVERALVTYCADQFNLTAILDSGDRAQGLRAALAGTRQRIAQAEAQLDRLTAALLADEGAPPVAFARKARDPEAQIAALGAEAEATEREIALAARADTPALTEAWAALATGALALDEAARRALRQLVADTFARLVIYHRGARPDESDGRSIDLILIAKGGATRLLRIDRKSGAWRAGEDLAGD